MPQKRAVCFVDDEWEVFLYPDSSLTVCRTGEPILGGDENVFDFLGSTMLSCNIVQRIRPFIGCPSI